MSWINNFHNNCIGKSALILLGMRAINAYLLPFSCDDSIWLSTMKSNTSFKSVIKSSFTLSTIHAKAAVLGGIIDLGFGCCTRFYEEHRSSDNKLLTVFQTFRKKNWSFVWHLNASARHTKKTCAACKLLLTVSGAYQMAIVKVAYQPSSRNEIDRSFAPFPSSPFLWVGSVRLHCQLALLNCKFTIDVFLGCHVRTIEQIRETYVTHSMPR